MKLKKFYIQNHNLVNSNMNIFKNISLIKILMKDLMK